MGEVLGGQGLSLRSISVCPAVRRGVGLRDEAARQVEAVSDGDEGERGPSFFLPTVFAPLQSCPRLCHQMFAQQV